MLYFIVAKLGENVLCRQKPTFPEVFIQPRFCIAIFRTEVPETGVEFYRNFDVVFTEKILLLYMFVFIAKCFFQRICNISMAINNVGYILPPKKRKI